MALTAAKYQGRIIKTFIEPFSKGRFQVLFCEQP